MTETPIPLSPLAPVSTTVSTAADRMRRSRERLREGLLWLGIELRETEVGALVRKGLLLEESRQDRDAVTRALYAFLERELSGESLTRNAADA
jgi:hypothetical protein